MTRERLSQLSWLKLEIEELTGRVSKLESALEGRAVQIDGMHFLGGPKDLVGDMVPLLTDLRDKLAACRRRALEEYTRLHTYIEEIEDSQVRTIFRLRYLDGLSWHQVAWRVGGNTADSVRMVHNRYLQRHMSR